VPETVTATTAAPPKRGRPKAQEAPETVKPAVMSDDEITKALGL
jgi:hypothetical protein